MRTHSPFSSCCPLAAPSVSVCSPPISSTSLFDLLPVSNDLQVGGIIISIQKNLLLTLFFIDFVFFLQRQSIAHNSNTNPPLVHETENTWWPPLFPFHPHIVELSSLFLPKCDNKLTNHIGPQC